MRKKVLLAVLALVFALALVVPASAITWGGPDGNAHPYVGSIWWPIPDMPGWFSLCSASAISATKLITAGHCAPDGDAVEVLFEYDGAFWGYYTARFYRHPEYCENCAPGLPGFINNDVAVVILDANQDIPLPNLPFYAQLPVEGLVDTLRMNTSIDLAGYGVQTRVHIPGEGAPFWTHEAFTRYYAPTELLSANFVHSDRFIKMRANPSQGSGGTCFGDSGGPNLLGGTHTILAVNSYVTNSQCAGVVYSNRIDTSSALTFINSIN